MKSLTLLGIPVLAVIVVVIIDSFVQQTNALTEDSASMINLERQVSTLKENVATLQRDEANLQNKINESVTRGAILQVNLAASEAKITFLQNALEKASDDLLRAQLADVGPSPGKVPDVPLANSEENPTVSAVP